MQKTQRQDALLMLVSAERISSQSDLAKRLRLRNFDVTQASISRDLDELGIVKAGGIYTLPKKTAANDGLGLHSVESSGDSLIVAKCGSGIASAVTVKIDAERIPGIVGTIAGDDTIFIAVRDAKAQKAVTKVIWEIFNR
jgi:transcriptional regulator of arginine metabolism